MANALARTGYSATQLALHWVIALLLVANSFATGEGMGQAWRANERGDATQLSGLVPQLHLWFGLAILAFAVWRVFLRQTRGVPEAPAEESAVLRMAAHVTHILLYALMLAIRSNSKTPARSPLPASPAGCWMARRAAAPGMRRAANMCRNVCS